MLNHPAFPFPVNTSTLSKLAKLNIASIWDLALHLPLRYEDETYITSIADAQIGEPVQIQATVVSQQIQFQSRKQLIVQVKDFSGHILYLRFIHFYPTQQQQLAEGNVIRAFGEIRHGFFGNEMVHPKIRTDIEKNLPESLTPVYPTVSGLNQPTLRRLIQSALKFLPTEDTLPAELLQQLQLPSLLESLHLLHFPPPQYSPQDLQEGNIPAWQRLKFDELLAQQLSMRLARQQRLNGHTLALIGDGHISQPLLSNLGFELTYAQQRTIREIKQDLAQNYPMHRLLQGDVGSGKTIVCALAAAVAIEAGFQVAVMAPTEILAEQHYLKFQQWFASLGIQIAWLSGSMRKKTKEENKNLLANGTAQLAIGTHALFQENVHFQNLGLVIVDEQHRFGVAQRLALKNKGNDVHQLMMSATPIPRTLAMSFFADLDVSVIDELPPGRTPIVTRLVNSNRRQEVEKLVSHTCAQGRQVYWVCPLIEESEVLQLQTAVDTVAELQQSLPEIKIGLIHGRLKSDEKAAVMAAFVQGEIQVLVATTVIEVGVDIPNASLMVIEHAERMGLAQLHQLRGRVGRGAAASRCVLLYSEPLGKIAKARLKVIYENTDGFEIASQDLNIRGPGEFLGARQSGIPMLRFANLETDLPLLEKARDLAPILLAQQPEIVKKHLQRWLSQRADYLGV